MSDRERVRDRQRAREREGNDRECLKGGQKKMLCLETYFCIRS